MGFSEKIKARRKKLDKPQKLYREILFTDNAEKVSHRLSVFVKEMRRENGGEYTPKDSFMLIAGLQREKCLDKQKQSGVQCAFRCNAQFEDF